MALHYLFRILSFVYAAVVSGVEKGQQQLDGLESKYEKTTKVYSLVYCFCWLGYLLFDMEQSYLFQLRGLVLMGVTYTLSFIHNVSIDPQTNRGLVIILICAFSKSFHEITCFSNQKLALQVAYFQIPCILLLALYKNREFPSRIVYAVPLLILAGVFMSFDLLMFLGTVLGLLGDLFQNNLQEQEQSFHSFFFMRGATLWLLGIVMQVNYGYDHQPNFLEIMLSTLFGGIVLLFVQYLIKRGKQLQCHDSYLLHGFLAMNVIAFIFGPRMISITNCLAIMILMK